MVINTPAPRTFDERVDQLLVKARSPMGEDEVRKVAELLEMMLDPHYPICRWTKNRCFRELVELCGEHGILPSSCLIPESKVEKLGEEPVAIGGFSDVWPGIYEEETWVAVKVIRCYGIDSVKDLKGDFCREVITWKRLCHPNVLELIGATMNESEWAVVSPWMECGNIVDYVREDPQVNPLKLLEGAARGLEYLHGVELAHGDLKGANILISDDGRACLADFGLTRVIDDLSSPATATEDPRIFSLRWAAPEAVYPERFGFWGGPTKESDIYSMAMTIYEVLTDKIPFYGRKETTVMLLVGQGVRPTKPNPLLTRGYTNELWEMTISCWNEKRTERPTIGDVLGALNIAAGRWKPRWGDF